MDRQRLFGKEIEVEFARGERKSLLIYFEIVKIAIDSNDVSFFFLNEQLQVK